MSELDFDQLVETYYQSLYRFAMSLSGRESDASDLTQQTFLLWATKGGQLRDLSKVKTWLFTTLYREFLRGNRRQQRHPHQSIEGDELDLPEEIPVPDRALDAAQVMDALKVMDEVYRVPLTLFYVQQISYKEIAEILEIPIGTVMSRISRAKQALRKSLSEGEAL